MGGYGWDSIRTTEKIIQDGSTTASFDLKYAKAEACAINLGSSVILTGGYSTSRTVSEYNETGWVRDLSDLLQGRFSHGCSSYDNNDGTKTLLVAGGSSSDWLSSTE